MTVVERILTRATEISLSQKELAAKLDVSQQAITDWKKGRTTSYTKCVPQIAEVLGVSVEWLLTGAGEDDKETATPKDSGLSAEFAKLFESLTPENQNVIIAEMLKRQREQ